MKKIIRLTEQDLTKIVRRVINEADTKVPGCVKGDCKNGYGERNYDWGSYKGHFKNGEFSGYGVFKAKDGFIYKGNFKNDVFDGYGESNVNGNSYKGQFKNGDKNGYGTLKLDTGGVYKGNFSRGAGDGYGVFTNRYGRVFKGQWMSAANSTILKVPSETENKQYGNMDIYDLETVKKSSNLETKKCVVPTNDYSWLTANFDKNYEYINGGKDFGFCWWARNIKNGKVFNLSELVKKNPKIQKSIDILNKEYLDSYNF